MKLKVAKQLAEETIQQHLGESWHFKFDNAARRFGHCSYYNKTISLSKQIVQLNDQRAVYDTILHEVAHALTGTGHDMFWKRTAKSMGCSATRLYDSNVIATPKPKWLAVCDNCHHEVPYMVRRRKMACGRCCRKYNFGKYTVLYLIRWVKL